ncbi:transcriptional regulator with HTH domain and aminotransferase domain-containing protein [Pseudomonas sp. GM84]|uniref:aminotransferase class I/II-fold pyridoxal phosphate-dependent enzyme n=1 Tax=Pseudomonas sp. GM84 TaxID=1144340 RepID=UPI00026F4CCD|nr:aminotransferase class I/II-fold pyridoxal phosphate-dependent enzyme [Pseudomonas sp. GM84]EJN39651.1 transcriptional regulator with HTH domain and aminotransferase domain-containing protein [Pseudomonas sp. GM84]
MNNARGDKGLSKFEVDTEYQRLKSLGLTINMARGIPSPAQIQLSQALLSLSLGNDYMTADGVDSRNYGGQIGVLEARRLFAPMVGIPESQIVVGGNSSLAMMYECLAQAWRRGTPDSQVPWSQEPDGIAFICIVPGYDRHFAMCEDFGIRMISVPMLQDGPDMERVRSLVANDPSIKGIWCVPKYSNPTGTTYSPEVVEALASMPTAAADFRIFWDNAYAVHPLAEVDQPLADLYSRCEVHGHASRALIFASTSKMTLPGAGMAMFGASPANIDWWVKAAMLRSVGPDKVNQVRQVRFLKSIENIEYLMEQHRVLLKPKFDRVDQVFQERLGGLGIASWTRPAGGYFVSLQVQAGTAKRVVELASGVGLTFSSPGSCFPYGIDPDDSQLRLAPSYPELDELTLALEIIATCVIKASLDRQVAH